DLSPRRLAHRCLYYNGTNIFVPVRELSLHGLDHRLNVVGQVRIGEFPVADLGPHGQSRSAPDPNRASRPVNDPLNRCIRWDWGRDLASGAQHCSENLADSRHQRRVRQEEIVFVGQILGLSLVPGVVLELRRFQDAVCARVLRPQEEVARADIADSGLVGTRMREVDGLVDVQVVLLWVYFLESNYRLYGFGELSLLRFLPLLYNLYKLRI